MKSKRTTAEKELPREAGRDVSRDSNRQRATALFDRDNLLWMLGAGVLIILGFILMAGGRSEDPNVFDPNEVYSTRRITIAPIVILIGLVVLIVAIFRQPKHR